MLIEPLRSESALNELSVVTLNVFVGAPLALVDMSRCNRLAHLLLQERAYFYCLQEVFTESVVRMLHVDLGQDYKFVGDGTRHLRVALRYAADLGLLCLVLASVWATQAAVCLMGVTFTFDLQRLLSVVVGTASFVFFCLVRRTVI